MVNELPLGNLNIKYTLLNYWLGSQLLHSIQLINFAGFYFETMEILCYHFRALRILGFLWDRDSSAWIIMQKIIYRVILMVVIIYIFLGEVSGLIKLTYKSIQQFTDMLFMCVYVIYFVLKNYNVTVKQELLTSIVRDFHDQILQPKTEEERKILEKYEQKARNIFFALLTMNTFTAFAQVLTPLLAGTDNLPYSVYNFLNLPERIFYLTAYVDQLLAAILAPITNSCLDNGVYGLFIATAGQFDLLAHRFSKMSPSDGDIDRVMRQHLEHHLLLQKIVFKVKTMFIEVIVIFFLSSIVMLSTCILQLSQVDYFGFIYNRFTNV